MKLLIATHNQGKLEDYRQFCRGMDIDLISLKDLKITDEFDEIYPTFEQNAKAKAEFYYQLAKIPTLADDSGIEIPYYDMGPGVKTKRWTKGNINFIVEKIIAIPPDKRQAQLRAVEAYCDGKQTVLEEGIIQGLLTDKIYTGSQTHGYPWDLVFIIPELGKYYEELTDEENLKYNHRKIAFDKLKQYMGK